MMPVHGLPARLPRPDIQNPRGVALRVIVAVLALAALYLLSRTNFLVFHSLAELFSIVIAMSLFAIYWGARRYLEHDYLLFLSIAYLFTGVIDLLHTLAYKGMGVFTGFDANLPTQLWIAARYLESLSLLCATFLLGRRIRPGRVFAVYSVLLALIIGSTFFVPLFPASYIEGSGLTPFKKISEYIICLILIATIGRLYQHRRAFEPVVFRLLVAALVTTIFAELTFTFYVGLYGLSNFVGHIFKIVSFFLVYQVLIGVTLRRPYDLMFRTLHQSETSLRESQRQLTTLMGNLPGMAYRCKNDPDWTMEFVSEGSYELTGYRPAELVGNARRSYAQIIHPADRQMVWEEAQAGLLARRARQHTYRILTAGGAEKWVWEQAQGVYDDAGTLVAVEGFITDVTARKQAEEALQESETRFRSLYENATVGLYRTTPDGRILMANRTLVQMLGYASLAELGRRDLTREGYEPEYPRRKFQEEIERTGEIIGLEAAWKRKDGGAIYVRESARLVRAADGSPLYYEGTVEDITARKQAQEHVHFQASLLNAVGQAVIATDLNGTITYFNQAAEALYGWPAAEALGRPIMEVTVPEVSQEQAAEIMAALVQGKTWSGEFLVQRRDGTVFPAMVSDSPIRDETGAHIGIIGISTDLTHLKQAQEALQNYSARLEAEVNARTRELQQTQEQLMRQEKLAVLGELAGGVGHELRNPLAVIHNAVYYLRLVQPQAAAKVIEYLDMIERECDNATGIINDLLDFARIKSVQQESIVVAELVRDVLTRFPPTAGVNVTLDLPAHLPPVQVDSRQVGQVLGNLITNACQAMPQGGELVIKGWETRDGGRPAAGGYQAADRREPAVIAISVQDTGVGISPKNLEKLFEPLFTTKTKGIGLGLAISKKLIEANGGRIEAQSELGAGSRFTIYLPASKPTQAQKN